MPSRGQHSVVIAGAGICGLSTALALGRQGVRSVVLEARSDPDSPAARDRLDRARKHVADANAALKLGDAERADQHFERASLERAPVWGSRQRNLMLDHHTLEFLRELGVAVETLPPLLQLDTHFGPGQPSICIRYGQRRSAEGSGRIDAATLIAQRDPVSATTISDLEFLLLRAAVEQPLIEVRFDSPVMNVEEDEDRVAVEYGGAGPGVIEGQLLLLADGGGGRSLSRRLGIDRATVGHEEMNIAVFRCPPESSILGHSLAHPWIDARTTKQGWVVYLCSGSGRLTVNTRCVNGNAAESALDIALRSGADATLLERPSTFRYTLDRAVRFAHGRRTLLAGDAACRASPIWAFGAQFGMVWAQMAADLFDGVAPDSPIADDALRRYCIEAERVARMRLDFEASVIGLVDAANGDVNEAPDAGISRNFLSAVDEIDLTFNASSATGGQMALRLGIDVGELISASNKPDLSAFCSSVGRFGIDGLLDLEYQENGGGTMQSLDERPLNYRTNLEDVRVDGGRLAVHRDPAGYWSFSMQGVDLHRDVDASGSNSVAAIEHAELRLPDAFVDALVRNVGPQIWAFGATRKSPVRFDVELAPGTIELGTFRVALSGSPKVRVTLSRQRDASLFSFELVEGSATSRDFAEFSRRTRIGATQLIRAGQALFGKLADPLIDFWASAASRAVRRVDFKVFPNGSGKATYYFLGAALPVMMSRRDVTELMSALFDSESCERIMHQYQRSIRSARVDSASVQ